jgi:molybdate transport system ATP-binding protein
MPEDDTRRCGAGAPLSVDIARRLSDFTLEAAFESPPGFTMLLGPSGGGKTTLLNCIAGLVRPDRGRIALGANVLFDREARLDVPVQKRRVGYVFQNLALFPHLTVAQNVQYGIMRVPEGERRARMTALLESFRIPHLADRKPGQISGGERQRAALARALVTDPAVLLLDEPLVALDNAAKSRILDDLRAWNNAHSIPIIFVTHAPQEAFALGERVVILESGRVVAQGLPQEVLAAPRHETVAQIVGFENVFDAVVTALHEHQGTMLCRLERSACELEVPLIRTGNGAAVRVAIRAGDIMIATGQAHGLSARNAIAGKVQAVRREGVTVVLYVEAGVTFEVHVTPSAAEELALVPGRQVWLVIKTYSCNLIERRNSGG